jgi:hypothetical protein
MEPKLSQKPLMNELQEAYAEIEVLEARNSELEREMAANRERQAQAWATVRRLTAIIRNTFENDAFMRHHIMMPAGIMDSVHVQIRREILDRPEGVSRADLKSVFSWVNDKTLDNVIFRLCRNGEVLRDPNRRGYYLPSQVTPPRKE